MSEWSFRNIDLTGVDMQTGGRLREGRHLCQISKVEFADNKAGTGKVLKLEYTALDGSGSTTEALNVYHSNPDAQNIARRRLKTLLTYARHPNPDRPSDVNSIKGLKVGIIVAKTERSWVDQNGKEHKHSYDVTDGAAYFPVEGDVDDDAFAFKHEGGRTSKPELDDKIPF